MDEIVLRERFRAPCPVLAIVIMAAALSASVSESTSGGQHTC